ncbi:MAG: hypothetical protein M1823_003576, partial [Watsoniomyces obsoletus]
PQVTEALIPKPVAGQKCSAPAQKVSVKAISTKKAKPTTPTFTGLTEDNKQAIISTGRALWVLLPLSFLWNRGEALFAAKDWVSAKTQDLDPIIPSAPSFLAVLYANPDARVSGFEILKAAEFNMDGRLTKLDVHLFSIKTNKKPMIWFVCGAKLDTAEMVPVAVDNWLAEPQLVLRTITTAQSDNRVLNSTFSVLFFSRLLTKGNVHLVVNGHTRLITQESDSRCAPCHQTGHLSLNCASSAQKFTLDLHWVPNDTASGETARVKKTSHGQSRNHTETSSSSPNTTSITYPELPEESDCEEE